MARNKYPEVTEERILDVAQRLFLEKGYENTTIQDLSLIHIFHVDLIVVPDGKFLHGRLKDFSAAAFLALLLSHPLTAPSAGAPPSWAFPRSPAHSKPFLAINTALISLMTAAAALVP